MRDKPGGHETHSSWRLFSHFVSDPKLPSTCASKSETKGKGAGEVPLAFFRLLRASDRKCESHCNFASSIQIAPEIIKYYIKYLPGQKRGHSILHIYCCAKTNKISVIYINDQIGSQARSWPSQITKETTLYYSKHNLLPGSYD